jgi:transcriptional regulator with XRE-family HTH domain
MKRIEKERALRKQSIRQFADATGISKSLWAMYLKGDRNPTWENLFTAAKALEMKVEIDVT